MNDDKRKGRQGKVVLKEKRKMKININLRKGARRSLKEKRR